MSCSVQSEMLTALLLPHEKQANRESPPSQLAIFHHILLLYVHIPTCVPKHMRCPANNPPGRETVC